MSFSDQLEEIDAQSKRIRKELERRSKQRAAAEERLGNQFHSMVVRGLKQLAKKQWGGHSLEKKRYRIDRTENLSWMAAHTVGPGIFEVYAVLLVLDEADKPSHFRLTAQDFAQDFVSVDGCLFPAFGDSVFSSYTSESATEEELQALLVQAYSNGPVHVRL